MKEEIQGVMTGVECPDCHGDRLKPTSLAVTVGGVNISKFTQMSVREELDFINGLQLHRAWEHMIAGWDFKRDPRAGWAFCRTWAWDYLTLAQQRGHACPAVKASAIRLATQIGSALTGVLYVLG